MKSKKLFCLVLALIFSVAGCKKKPSESAEAKPNPKIDYLAKINELAKAGRDESLNAAPFYQKAIELCVEQPEEVRAINRRAWPADLSTKEQSVLKQWVQSNSEALSQLELGTKKPYYCYFVCPFGALQELVYKASRLHIRKPPPAAAYSVNIRKVLLLIIAVLILLDAGVNFTLFEPFTFFLFRSASLVVLAIAAVSLILSVFIARPWCHYACPTGALLDLFRTS